MADKVNLYQFLKSTYGDKKALDKVKQAGYNYDSMLSNSNVKVFHRPSDNKLLVGVAGTHNFSDILTDINLAFGNLKGTSRYKEAKDILKQAKTKYNPSETIVGGHSLGGSISQYIASKRDKAVTLDKGATIGQKTRSNERAYRTEGDAVSLLASGAKNMTTLANRNTATGFLPTDVLKAHNLTSIKKENIQV
jgi:hypothetical protein